MQSVKTIVQVCILVALYYLVYYIYIGHLHPLPLDGDSWDYHIPIALSILNGSFITAHFSTIPHTLNPVTGMIHYLPQWYYPASSEIINALFIFLHIPTFSNIFAAVTLFFCLWKLGRTFRMSNYYSLLFALAFCTLNVILRWLNAVSIDVWVGVWFSLSIILLENPKKNIRYFAKLGFVLGMLIGSKYTAIYFIVVLFAFYFKKIIAYVNISRGFVFLAPFSIFGLFWYVRNYILKGNPFYPVPRLGFKGPLGFNDTVWAETLRHPIEMLNAGFGEYHLWVFLVLIAAAVLVYRYIVKKEFTLEPINKLFLMGVITFILYSNFPTSPQSWIMVSSFRYSLPIFILLMLGTFMLAQKYRKEELMGYIVVANMIPVLTMSYYPKLIIIYLPISIGIFYVFSKHSQKRRQ